MRVQGLALQPDERLELVRGHVTVDGGEELLLRQRVELVAEQGVAREREVDPDLVLTTGVRTAAHERDRFAAQRSVRERLDVRLRGQPSLAHRHRGHLPVLIVARTRAPLAGRISRPAKLRRNRYASSDIPAHIRAAGAPLDLRLF